MKKVFENSFPVARNVQTRFPKCFVHVCSLHFRPIIDGTNHQMNKNWLTKHKISLLMNPEFKIIGGLWQFEMRYPVL